MKKKVYNLGLVAILGLGTFVNAQVKEGVVGINTDTPDATLDVRTKTGTNKSLKVVSSSNRETVTVLDNGKVGIGVDNPKEKLEVDGNAVFNTSFYLKSSRGVKHAIFNYPAPEGEDINPLYIGAGQSADGQKNDIILYNYNHVGGANVPNIKLYADLTTSFGDLYTTKKLRIGQVDAGDSSTDKVLVRDNDGYVKSVAASSLAGETVQADNGLTKEGNNIRLGGNLTKTTNINLSGNNLITTGEGNVGIGIVYPAAKLEVKSPAGDYAALFSRNDKQSLGIMSDGDGNKIISRSDENNGKMLEFDSRTDDKYTPKTKGYLGYVFKIQGNAVARIRENKDSTDKEIGQFEVEGTSNMKGAQYVNIRIVTDADFTLQPTDYMINYKGGGGTVTLPEATESTGRVVCFYNYDGGALATGAQGNAGNIQPSYGGCIISDGTEWITKNAY